MKVGDWNMTPLELADSAETFANGVEEGGQPTYAQVLRTVADELRRQYMRAETEHDLRVIANERADGWQRLWSKAASEAGS